MIDGYWYFCVPNVHIVCVDPAGPGRGESRESDHRQLPAPSAYRGRNIQHQEWTTRLSHGTTDPIITFNCMMRVTYSAIFILICLQPKGSASYTTLSTVCSALCTQIRLELSNFDHAKTELRSFKVGYICTLYGHKLALLNPALLHLQWRVRRMLVGPHLPVPFLPTVYLSQAIVALSIYLELHCCCKRQLFYKTTSVRTCASGLCLWFCHHISEWGHSFWLKFLQFTHEGVFPCSYFSIL